MKIADVIGYAVLIAILFECFVIVTKAIREEERERRRHD